MFDERIPKKVLYVNDVSASGTQWHGVFVADTEGEGGSQLTLADSAIVIAEPKQGIQEEFVGSSLSSGLLAQPRFVPVPEPPVPYSKRR